jgi:mycothiol synthase
MPDAETSWLPRPFAEADYPALAALQQRVFPEALATEVALRYEDARLQEPYRRGRWVLEQGGELVGWGGFYQHPSWYHPDRYALELGVAPEAQRRGVGGALYRTLVEALQAHGTRSGEAFELRTTVRGRYPHQFAFFTRRGFVERQRSWLLRLEVARLTLAPWEPLLAELRAQGYTFASVGELERDEGQLYALYTFYQELVADVPRTQAFTPWSFEQFVAHRRTAPNLLPAGSFVALHQGTFAGVSELKRGATPEQLQTGLTAVRRAYRGRKLALACKVMALRYAQAHGATTVTTRNAASNAAMLKINRALGFVVEDADIELVATLYPDRAGGVEDASA